MIEESLFCGGSRSSSFHSIFNLPQWSHKSPLVFRLDYYRSHSKYWPVGLFLYISKYIIHLAFLEHIDVCKSDFAANRHYILHCRAHVNKMSRDHLLLHTNQQEGDNLNESRLLLIVKTSVLELGEIESFIYSVMTVRAFALQMSIRRISLKCVNLLPVSPTNHQSHRQIVPQLSSLS